MTRHVIIGNGIAGVNAAESIRSLDGDSSITMIARETFPPYSRPMISLVLAADVNRRRSNPSSNILLLSGRQFQSCPIQLQQK